MHFRRAFKDSIPVLMGYSTMGFASGLLLAVGGAISWSPLWAAVTSAAFVSGPLQYIFVDWMATSLALGSVLLVTLCVNFRYSLYGLSLIERFQGASLWQKAYLIGTITDETYALQMACDLKGGSYVTYCLFLTMLDHLYWICGVTAGAVVGVLAQGAFSPEKVAAATQGIDFAMTALFLVILADLLRHAANRLPALIGLVAALVAVSVFGKGGMLIPAISLIVAAFLALRRWLDGK